jgi:hypothetical protein
MTHTSEWELLSDARDRVMQSSSFSRDQAEAEICRGISAGAIGIRAKLAKHTIKLQTSHLEVDGSDLRIPTQLEPHDLEWQQSRPTNPWWIRDLPPLYGGPWRLAWLKLSKADVTQVLLRSEKSIAASVSEAPSKAKRKRTTPKLDAVRAALKTLFPGGIPSQEDMLNDKLADRVIKHVKKNNGLHVSRDTVLRATGRRK